jgi:hypothetical protein
MCVNLAYYLVRCGVSKSSVAILTPYKGQLMLIRKMLLSDQSNARLLTHDSSNSNQVRLSTVDRFQGDEADVVIASLVVDEKSRTQFVKLQNRMIVLLSRARIGCFVLGNIGYFESSRNAGGRDAKHWMRTFEMLESPPQSSDNNEQSITVSSALVPVNMQESLSSSISIPLKRAHFEDARVGPTFPLCCPRHPLLSRRDAKSASDLKLGFCQIACEEALGCSHPCLLNCHWPKKTHNPKCKVDVDSPCSKHPSKLQCWNVFKNSVTIPGDSIDIALQRYKCPETVTVMLPCCHEEQLPCWQEDEIAQNKSSYPDCNRTAMSPFVYDCGHELEVTCSQLALYTRDPSQLKHCAEMVQYHPADCSHSKTIKCYIAKEFNGGQRKYICPEKLTVELPRCGHEARVSEIAAYFLDCRHTHFFISSAGDLFKKRST